MVVFIHVLSGYLAVKPFCNDFEKTISKGMVYIANPLFFILSGFFFFNPKKTFTLDEYLSKIKKRVKTLFIPFIIVSILSFIIALTLNYFHIYKFGHINIDLRGLSCIDLFKSCFIYPRLSYQLWFIINLMVLCLFSPFIFFLIKHIGKLYVAMLISFWLFLSPLSEYNMLSLAFFSLGAYLSINKIKIPLYKNEKQTLLIVSLFLWIVLSYIAVVWVRNDFILYFIRNISIIAGLISMWSLYDYLFIRIKKYTLSSISEFSFFIYLFHEPLLTFLRIGILYIIKTITPLNSFIIYLLLPIITISICIITATILKKYNPKAYNILTGDR